MGSGGVGNLLRVCCPELCVDVTFVVNLKGDFEQGHGVGDFCREGRGDLARLRVGEARFDQEPSPYRSSNCFLERILILQCLLALLARSDL